LRMPNAKVQMNVKIQRPNRKALTLNHSCPVRYEDDKNHNLPGLERY